MNEIDAGRQLVHFQLDGRFALSGVLQAKLALAVEEAHGGWPGHVGIFQAHIHAFGGRVGINGSRNRGRAGSRGDGALVGAAGPVLNNYVVGIGKRARAGAGAGYRDRNRKLPDSGVGGQRVGYLSLVVELRLGLPVDSPAVVGAQGLARRGEGSRQAAAAPIAADADVARAHGQGPAG